MSGQQIEVQSPPTDGVSAVIFANHQNNRLLASSWDRKVYLYDVTATSTKLTTTYQHKAAVMDCAFADDDSIAFSGSIDGELLSF